MTALTPVARRLRRNQTQVERLLWAKRDRRLAGWKFRRQFPIGPFVVDFCCLDAWLVIELDGGQHSAEAAVERDAARSAEIERRGYLVARFWNGEVVSNLDGTCETILNLLDGTPVDLSEIATSRLQPFRPEQSQPACLSSASTPLPSGERSSRRSRPGEGEVASLESVSPPHPTLSPMGRGFPRPNPNRTVPLGRGAVRTKT